MVLRVYVQEGVGVGVDDVVVVVANDVVVVTDDVADEADVVLDVVEGSGTTGS